MQTDRKFWREDHLYKFEHQNGENSVTISVVVAAGSDDVGKVLAYDTLVLS
jgi:hypothetical protein